MNNIGCSVFQCSFLFLYCLPCKYICINTSENYRSRGQKNRDINIKINIVWEPGHWPGILEIEIVEVCPGERSVFSTFGHASLNIKHISGQNIGSCEWSLGLPCFIFSWGCYRESTKVWRKSKTKWVCFLRLSMLLADLSPCTDASMKAAASESAHTCSTLHPPWLIFMVAEWVTHFNQYWCARNSFIRANSLLLWKVDRLLRNVQSLH